MIGDAGGSMGGVAATGAPVGAAVSFVESPGRGCLVDGGLTVGR